MKISDVLWEAACNYSDGMKIKNGWGYSCNAIEWAVNDYAKARSFYKKRMSPRPKNCDIVWFGSHNNRPARKQRFFHLLMAYEMAKSEGL